MARSLVVAALVAWLVIAVDWESTWHTLQQTQPLPVLAALALTLATIGTHALRWQLLLKVDGEAPSLATLYRYHLAGIFTSNVLPTSFGGDAYRVHMLATSGCGHSRAVASVAVERALGASALFAMALCGVILSPSASRQSVTGAALALGLLLCLGALVILIASSALHGILKRVPLVGSHANSLLEASRSYLSHPKRVLAALVLSVVSTGATAANAYLFASAVGSAAPGLEVAAVGMVVIALSALPISINGYGVAEASWLLLLSDIGLEPGAAGAIAVLWRLSNLGVSLLGGIVMLRGTRAVLPAPAESGR